MITDAMAAYAKIDKECADKFGSDRNPFSTAMTRDLWERGFNGLMPLGLTDDQKRSWTTGNRTHIPAWRAWARGVEARKLLEGLTPVVVCYLYSCGKHQGDLDSGEIVLKVRSTGAEVMPFKGKSRTPIEHWLKIEDVSDLVVEARQGTRYKLTVDDVIVGAA